MERNNLENQIQEKLFSIEIKPSAQSWDRLDAMLTVAEEKKTKKKSIFTFRNIGIAASFLIFPVIAISIYLGNSNPKIPTHNNQTTIVNTEIEIPEIETVTSNKIKDNEILILRLKSKNQNQKQVAVSIITRELRSNWRSNPKTVSNQSQAIAEQVIKEKEVPQPFVSQEVVITNPKNAIAEIAIPSKKEASNAKIKVNATSLLSQVDGELEQTYRETKLEKIARNFNSVKVALANRNNE